MDSDERVSNGQYEFELGWNTSSPRFQFPDSDKAEVDTNANGRDPCSPLGENPPPPHKIHSSVQESLGKYTTLLPGSSPPRPPFKMRKRHPKVWQSQNIKRTKLGMQDSHSESASLVEAPGSPLSDIEIVEVSVRKSPGESLESLEAIENELSKATLLDAEISHHDKSAQPAVMAQTELSVQERVSAPKKYPFKSLSDAELASFHDIDDIEDLGVDEVDQPPVVYQKSFFNNRKTRRFVVQSVTELPERTVLNCLDVHEEEQFIELRGSWRESVINRGDTIHLVSPKPSVLMTVDPGASLENQLLLIVNPDVLIPCTTVSMAMSCERQVILNTQIRAPSDLNENLVLGSIKHEFIQSCFTHNTGGDFTTTVMTEGLKRACENNVLDLRLVGSDVESAFVKLEKIIPDIQAWASKIWGKKSQGIHLDSIKLRIDRAIQIEEEIRSPYLGLIGKIDVTCDVTHFGDKSVTRLAGLEIKTGKFTQSVGHRVQTALYTLLMAERHPNNTHPWSLLYYTETGSTSIVALKPPEIASLIQRRNKVAHDMWSLPGRELPLPVSASDMACKWCNRKNSCVLYTEIDDQGNTHDLSALTAVYQRIKETGSLKPKFLAFVKHWHMLLDLEFDTESKQSFLKQRQWWVEDHEPKLWKLDQKLSNEGAQSCEKQYSLIPANDIHFNASDISGRPVLLSTKQQMALNFGFVTGSGEKEIRVILQHDLPAFGKYRIDTDPYLSDVNLGLARFNLNSLMDNDRLRELIVDLTPPKWHLFDKEMINTTIERASYKVLHTQSASSSIIEQSGGSFKSDKSLQTHGNLNLDQGNALNRVLNARDYALILGMPGTGKTTTIAAIVASLVERGKTVLVSAYTNSAVDTIVQKLLDAQQNCLRLISSNYDTALMSHEVAAVSVSMSANTNNSRLLDFLSAPVVACTSHGTNNKIFSLRQFDYCILDEASQITLPFVLGPIRLAPVFVLVGDHYQLPPLVRNQRARKLGMDQSLFKILSEAHPEAVVALTKQYRMCQDIMSLSSELVYDGRLVAGNEVVANQKLHINGWSYINSKSPIYVPLNPENRVVFLDTDNIGEQAREMKHDDGSSNPGEAKIVCNLVRMLADLGVALTDCAVISVYRHQLASLSTLLEREVDKGLEILTADQAQGRDKNCIIVSLVKSNKHASAGELLKDWRRLNVAFTRAKQKLIIIGSKRTMQQADGVARFFKYIESRGWVHPASFYVIA